MPDTIWNIIQPGLSIQEMQSNLSSKSTEKILQFQKDFQKLLSKSYTARLRAAAYLILEGCSDDGFEYFRSWLISRGETIFEAAVLDPDSLAEIIDLNNIEADQEEIDECGELVLGLAYGALTMKGEDPKILKPDQVSPHPDISKELEEMDFDSPNFMASILPKLSTKLSDKSNNESQDNNLNDQSNDSENKTINKRPKFPPLIWSSAIYNILVSLWFFWLFATQFNSINETFTNSLNISGLWFVIPYTITSLIGLTTSFGLLFRKKWAWYGVVFLIIYTTLGIIINSFGLVILGLVNITPVIVRTAILLLFAIPLIKSFNTERIRNIYGVQNDNDKSLKLVFVVAFVSQVVLNVISYIF